MVGGGRLGVIKCHSFFLGVDSKLMLKNVAWYVLRESPLLIRVHEVWVGVIERPPVLWCGRSQIKGGERLICVHPRNLT